MVLLRRWRPTDVDTLADIWQDDELQRRFGVEPPVTTGSTAAYVDGVADRWCDGVQVSLALTVDGALAGGCDLDHLDTNQPDLGYWLAPDARDRGSATRAGALLLAWAAAALEVTEVCIEVEHDNAPSIRVAERLGFTLRAGVERPRRSTPEEAPLAVPTKGDGVERPRRSTPEEAPLAVPTKGDGDQRRDGSRGLVVYEVTMTRGT